MGFNDLDEFFDSSLRLPIGGREYVVPSPDGATGLWVERLMAITRDAADGKEIDEQKAAKLELDDEEERTLHERLLGPAMVAMLEDGVEWEKIKLAGTTALLWTGVSLQAAELYWNSGGNPEAPAPNRETARAAGRSTRSRGSGSGTTTRAKVVRGEVVPTRGKNSSPTGR